MLHLPEEIQTPHELLAALEPRIRERARNIFESRKILVVEKIENDMISALVLGAKTYKMTVRYRDGNISHTDCDCPADKQPVCKHLGALLMHIIEHEIDLIESTPSMKIIWGKLQKMPPLEQQRLLLEILRDQEHERRYLSILPALSDEAISSTFEAELLSYTRAARAQDDLQGERNRLFTVYNCLQPFLKRSLEWCMAKKYEPSFALLSAIIRIQHQVPDSEEPQIGERFVYQSVLRILTEMVISDLADDFKKQLWRELRMLFAERLRLNRDYFMVRVLSHLATSDTQRDELRSLIRDDYYLPDSLTELQEYISGARLTKENYRAELIRKALADSVYPHTFSLDNYAAQCDACMRYFHAGCEAFPEGIPAEILRSEILHDKPYAGDQGLLFEGGV
ncbi:MAG: hypothetical protein JSR44_01075 [Spirochaetes bacterium]|nr:hypothetical protein [Spirochaetota bacterium]